MTNPEVAILMLSLFIVMVLFGFPVAFTLLAMGVGFGFYAYSDAGSIQTIADAMNNKIFYLLNQNTYSVMENDTLVAIPLFLFMGYVVERANIVNKLFYALQMAARNLPGSMAIAALSFSSVDDSSAAEAALAPANASITVSNAPLTNFVLVNVRIILTSIPDDSFRRA